MRSVILSLVISVATVFGHPDGAPLDACDTMTPVHSTYIPQTTTAPFNIALSSTSVTTADFVTVTLTANDGGPFQGFLLKGLPEGTDIGTGGSFYMTMVDKSNVGAMPCKYLACNNDPQGALTHVDSSNKTVITVDWQAATPGTYYIVGSVVQTFPTFWVKFQSDPIEVSI